MIRSISERRTAFTLAPMFSVSELPRVTSALAMMAPVHFTGGGLSWVTSLSASAWGAPPSTGTTCTVPSSPGATFERNVESPDFTTIGSSVEKVLTLARSTVTSPAPSVLMVTLPPSALTILPVRRSPFRNWISSAPAREASTSETMRAPERPHSDQHEIEGSDVVSPHPRSPAFPSAPVYLW